MNEQIKQALQICTDHADIDANGNPDDWMRVATLLDSALQSVQVGAIGVVYVSEQDAAKHGRRFSWLIDPVTIPDNTLLYAEWPAQVKP